MNPTAPDFLSLSQAYNDNVQASRQTMTQMLNIMREQDRAMREALRDTERFTRNERSRVNSPAMRPYSTVAPGLSSSSMYNIPYAPPRPAWEPNTSLSHSRPPPPVGASPDYGDSILSPRGAPPPPPLDLSSREPSRGYESVAQRLHRYRELAARSDPSLPYARNSRATEDWTQRARARRFHERYPNLADLSPVAVRPTLTEVATSTRELRYGDLDDTMNTECPITLRPFDADDSVIQIRQCRHVFSASAIRTWLETNVRCPVCRHDIREPLDVSGVAVPTTSNNITISSRTDRATDTHSLAAVNDDRPLTSIVAERLRGTSAETDTAAQSIMQYITSDIEGRLRENADISGNVMIEYGFVIPEGATEPETASVQVRNVTPEDLDDVVNGS